MGRRINSSTLYWLEAQAFGRAPIISRLIITLQELAMPDFLFLPSNAEMTVEMGSTAGQCSSAGNANTGKPLPTHLPAQTHTHRYVCPYAHTHQSRTNCEGETRRFGCPSCCDDKLGAQQALERNVRWVHVTAGSPSSNRQRCSCLFVCKSN